jgi:type II restriction/modification system DNA methylase subunit YeeA
VVNINADLTGTADITRAARLGENAGICFIGPSAHGPFDVSDDFAHALLRAGGNPNGLPNSDVVRPVISGIDIVQRPRGKWTIDFGLLSLADAALYEGPFEYARKKVYPIRVKNRRVAYAEKWWQYGEARPGLRSALVGKRRFIATPRVAKHRVFAWVPADVLPNDMAVVIVREDDYFLGVLQSKVHEVWSLHKGTALEDRPRYTPTTTFETFPFPWPPAHEPADDPHVQAIAEAARELVQLRDNWLNPPGASEADLKKRTLTNLYNQRPAWLDHAHRKLDAAVFAAYDWPSDLSDDDILARLLALNLERVARQGEATPTQAKAQDAPGE